MGAGTTCVSVASPAAEGKAGAASGVASHNKTKAVCVFVNGTACPVVLSVFFEESATASDVLCFLDFHRCFVAYTNSDPGRRGELLISRFLKAVSGVPQFSSWARLG